MQGGDGQQLSQRIAIAFGALALALGGLHPVFNNDLFGHMAAGREILQLGHVPGVDHFSFLHAEPQPWRNHNWLSGLLFFVLYDAGGANAVIALKLVVLALAGGLLVRLAQREGGTRAAWLCAVLVAVAIPAVRVRLAARPHLLGLLCAIVLVYALSRLVARPSTRIRFRWLAGLALVQCLWLNLHGSSLLGLAITLGYLVLHARAPSQRRELGALLSLQILASCASPWGPAVLLESVAHVADPSVGAMLSEWASFDETDPLWYTVALALQGLLLLLSARALAARGAPGLALLGLSVVLLLMGVRSSRFVLHALLIGAPAVAIGLARLWGDRHAAFARWLPATALPASVVALIGAAQLPPHMPPGLGESTVSIPAGSASWLRRHQPAARVVGSIEDAWYMSFAVPDSHVLLDGRVAVHGIDAFRQVLAAFADPQEFVALLDRHRADAVVLRHAFAGHAALVASLRAHPDWRLVMLEDRHALFVRGQGPEIRVLPAGYVPAAPRDAARAELSVLAEVPSALGYVRYYGALLQLAPYLRAQGMDGLEAGVPAGQTRSALEALRLAARRLPEVPIVHAYHALVAAHACALDEARDALVHARSRGDNRQALLVEQEIALRAGELAGVRAFVEAARQLPPRMIDGQRAGPDAWVAALGASLAQPPHCP